MQALAAVADSHLASRIPAGWTVTDRGRFVWLDSHGSATRSDTRSAGTDAPSGD